MVSCRHFLEILILLAATARAEEPSPEPDLRAAIEELRAHVARQDEEIAKLKEPKGLFRLGGLDIRLAGFVQADAIAYDQSSADNLNYSTGQPLNQTRFLINRARLRIEGDYKYAGGVLEFDGNTRTGATARITNAEVYGRIPGKTLVPYLMLSVGLTRIPFGFEVQELDWQRLFMERSNVVRAMFPGEYDLGAKLSGGWRWLRYQFAVMNGNPSGDKQFALRDPNESKDILGRLGVDSQIGSRVRLAGGLSALWGTGFHAGTGPTKDTVVWRDANLDGQIDPTELLGVLGMPGFPAAPFERWSFGADLRLVADLPKVGPLVIYGEVIWATNLDRATYPADPVAAGRDLRELGWYIALTQQLTRWAAIGIRYDRYDPDADRTEKVAASVVPRDLTLSTLSIVAAVMYQPYARLSLEWDHNTNALARNASGAPTTLGANQVIIRAQVLF